MRVILSNTSVFIMELFKVRELCLRRLRAEEMNSWDALSRMVRICSFDKWEYLSYVWYLLRRKEVRDVKGSVDLLDKKNCFEERYSVRSDIVKDDNVVWILVCIDWYVVSYEVGAVVLGKMKSSREWCLPKESILVLVNV
jgi:hypothetical protein